MKYTVHNKTGDYMHFGSASLDKCIDYANGFNSQMKVCETYFAPSPFFPHNITEHGKVVYTNNK